MLSIWITIQFSHLVSSSLPRTLLHLTLLATKITYPGCGGGAGKKTQVVLGVTDWMLRSRLIIDPKSIFLQHSPPLSSSSFHVALPSQRPPPSHRCLRCDIMLPGNSLFLICFHHFSDTKEWTAPSDLPTIPCSYYSVCGWMCSEHLFIRY